MQVMADTWVHGLKMFQGGGGSIVQLAEELVIGALSIQSSVNELADLKRKGKHTNNLYIRGRGQGTKTI